MQDKHQEANPCEPPHIHYIEAARGWLELGDAGAALDEIRRIDADLNNHPDVLLLTWHIQAALRDWDEAFKIGNRLVEVIPDDLQSWLNRAEAIRHMADGGNQQAYEALLLGENIFSQNYRFYFWLARYACLAGKLEDARRWLGEASALGNVKDLALDEPDLEPIREYAQRLAE